MSGLRRVWRHWETEIAFVLILLLWFGTSGFQGLPAPARSASDIGVALGGLAVLVRAITPLIRPRQDDRVDREDVRWQEHTSAEIRGLAMSIRDWAEEQRRHNLAVEKYMEAASKRDNG